MQVSMRTCLPLIWVYLQKHNPGLGEHAFSFVRNFLSSKVFVLLASPPARSRSSQWSTSSPALGSADILDFIHSLVCVVVS